MRRNVIWLLSTLAGLVFLVTYRPQSHPAASPAVAPSRSLPTGAVDGKYDGTLVRTPQGPVQVRITVANGQIIDVTAIVYPNDSPHHQEISRYSLPKLREEALRAQSADIHTVSGATETSEGYRESLRAAIDAARQA